MDEIFVSKFDHFATCSLQDLDAMYVLCDMPQIPKTAHIALRSARQPSQLQKYLRGGHSQAGKAVLARRTLLSNRSIAAAARAYRSEAAPGRIGRKKEPCGCCPPLKQRVLHCYSVYARR